MEQKDNPARFVFALHFTIRSYPHTSWCHKTHDVVCDVSRVFSEYVKSGTPRRSRNRPLPPVSCRSSVRRRDGNTYHTETPSMTWRRGNKRVDILFLLSLQIEYPDNVFNLLNYINSRILSRILEIIIVVVIMVIIRNQIFGT